jgi:hypothetical protein
METEFRVKKDTKVFNTVYMKNAIVIKDVVKNRNVTYFGEGSHMFRQH